MLNKYIYVNLDEVNIEVRQAGGVLQINKLSISDRTIKLAINKLDNCLNETFKVLNKYNKELSKDNKKEKNPRTPKEEKNQSLTVKGLQ
jgi:hypothetical protein